MGTINEVPKAMLLMRSKRQFWWCSGIFASSWNARTKVQTANFKSWYLRGVVTGMGIETMFTSSSMLKTTIFTIVAKCWVLFTLSQESIKMGVYIRASSPNIFASNFLSVFWSCVVVSSRPMLIIFSWKFLDAHEKLARWKNAVKTRLASPLLLRFINSLTISYKNRSN